MSLTYQTNGQSHTAQLATVDSAPASDGSSDGSSSNTAALAGGIVGGVLAVVVIAAIVVKVAFLLGSDYFPAFVIFLLPLSSCVPFLLSAVLSCALWLEESAGLSVSIKFFIV